jgi:N-methylhydantoinase B/oxoprolinase/acetone carboxylase alpha subunit
MSVDAISLEVFKHLFASVADDMGVTLQRAAFSPNIRERLDFSCAIFDSSARMIAQAAHIPVHLGSMPASVDSAIAAFETFAPGDVIVLNDPYRGGSHLPDVTMVSPIFVNGEARFFAASRAHHADVGGMSPGSLPLSTEL